MNLEVEYIPVSKFDLEKRWVSVRETLNEYSDKLLQFEQGRRDLSSQMATLQLQNSLAMETLASQSVQIQDLSQRLATLAGQVADLEGD
jgi:hypothetical protein